MAVGKEIAVPLLEPSQTSVIPCSNCLFSPFYGGLGVLVRTVQSAMLKMYVEEWVRV